jgi:hypothetical protein
MPAPLTKAQPASLLEHPPPYPYLTISALLMRPAHRMRVAPLPPSCFAASSASVANHHLNPVQVVQLKDDAARQKQRLWEAERARADLQGDLAQAQGERDAANEEAALLRGNLEEAQREGQVLKEQLAGRRADVQVGRCQLRGTVCC